MAIPNVFGVNPLHTTLIELGIVSGRVALLLRSAEIQPVFERFVRWTRPSPPSLPWWDSTTGVSVWALECLKSQATLATGDNRKIYARHSYASGCMRGRIGKIYRIVQPITVYGL